MEKATFGKWCYWRVESFFCEVSGVTDGIAACAGPPSRHLRMAEQP
jgi:peptide methionine sulfoxide reductase MsrA